MKGLKTYVLLSVAALVLGACSKKTKNETDNLAAMNNQADSSAESSAMSFDPQGSDSGKIAGLITVNFEYDKASLSSEARKKLKANAEWMTANPKVKIQIEGHCDSRGSIEYNLALGERRANAVRQYLETLGVGGDRLSTISFGEEKPYSMDESEKAWSMNRRANFVPSTN